MSKDELHKGDSGTQFTVTVKDGNSVVDISTATTKQFVFRKPDNTTSTVSASFVNSGTDGQLKYVVDSTSFLDKVGTWELQAYIVLTGGNEWHTDIYKFKVHRNVT